jgi:peptide/nickel transport system substrate-binding protein
MQLQSGQVDIASVPFNRVEEMRKTPGIRVEESESTDVRYISFNYTSPKFADIRVRQALTLATNQEEFIKAVWFNNAKPAKTFNAPSMPHYNDQLFDYKYDPERAKQLLAEASASNLKLNVIIISGDNTGLLQATLLKEQWSRVGVDLEIRPLDDSARMSERNNLTYEVLFSYITSDISDTSELMELMCIDEMNDSMHLGWRGPQQEKAEKLVKDAAVSTDEEFRTRCYYEAQKIFQEDYPMIPLALLPNINVMSDKVSGYLQTALGMYRFSRLTVTR